MRHVHRNKETIPRFNSDYSVCRDAGIVVVAKVESRNPLHDCKATRELSEGADFSLTLETAQPIRFKRKSGRQSLHRDFSF
jgi:hypothetical protein